MSRTNTTFGLLQAIAAIAAFAILLWSIGLPSFRFAEAASVTSLSDTLSDSAPAVGSDHTINFITPSGVANGSTIVVDFSDGPFVVGSVNFTDIDVFDDATSLDVAANCSGTEQIGASFSGSVLTLEFCSGDGGSLPTSGTTTILIGENAAGGNAQLTNPSVGSYEINLTVGASDIGSTRVAIIAPVVVTAAVDTSFTFTVAGLPGGTDVNSLVTTGTSTATAIAFGALTDGNASSAAQRLSVSTNASYGFAVTVQADQQLTSSAGADIDGFIDGAFTNTPVSWTSPTPIISDEDTWGHWGLTTNDATFGLSDPFDVGGAGNRFVSASTTPVQIFRHDGPADGTTQDIGRADVGYQVEISGLQEAGTDYTATLTYVATPVF
ncbi:hypothetical protein K2P47_03120 [Patescibacteria group bacterium]|nr:hypothetical protein [Patescibacteria group bacterium]